MDMQMDKLHEPNKVICSAQSLSLFLVKIPARRPRGARTIHRRKP